MRLLAGPPASAPASAADALAAHQFRHGPLRPRGGPADLIRELGAAGLTGRGGAAFPTARKIAAVRTSGQDAVVVANGAEGEPASRKDVMLLANAPHLVLDGLQLAGWASGARTALLYVHGGQPALKQQLAAAIAARQAAGSDLIPVDLVAAPARFLAGEETALVARLGGGAAVPMFKERRVFERGVAGRPTLVQNVETLAHIALIARHGAAWFRGVGTAAEPGSALCTIQQADGSVGVVEAAADVPVGALVRLDDSVQAVLAGGYHGGWLTVGEARTVTFSDADLRPAGTFRGAGVLAALPAAACGLAETARVARYLALESAGQCGPCLNGLPRIAVALAVLAQPRPAPAELAAVRRWAGLITGRGACHHPDGSARLVTSALRVFAAEIDAHAAGRCTGKPTRTFLPVPAAAMTEADWR